MPAVVVLAMARNTDATGSSPKLFYDFERALHLIPGANDADQVLHRFLQVVLNLIGILAGMTGLKRFDRSSRDSLRLVVVNGHRAVPFRELGCIPAGTPPEHKKVGK